VQEGKALECARQARTHARVVLSLPENGRKAQLVLLRWAQALSFACGVNQAG
jgi:hypothetical protein